MLASNRPSDLRARVRRRAAAAWALALAAAACGDPSTSPRPSPRPTASPTPSPSPRPSPSGHAISGKVSGAASAGVSVQLSGPVTATASPDESGHYAFTGLPDGTYTLTASRAGGYACAPASIDVVLLGLDLTEMNFAVAGAHVISGALAGPMSTGTTVTLTSGGATVATTTTTMGGYYVFSGLPDGAYEVTPTVAAGYAASPPERQVTLSGSDAAAQDFTVAGALSIAGTVSGDVLAGVAVTLSGQGTPGSPTTRSTIADEHGRYLFTGLSPGSYTIAPSVAGRYVFAPSSRQVTLADVSLAAQDFTSTGVYRVTGRVAGPVPWAITVTLTRGDAIVASRRPDDLGRFTFDGVPNGSYTVTPSLEGGYVFSPAAIPATVSGSDIDVGEFTYTGAGGVSGTITGPVRAGVKVTLSSGGFVNASTVTDAEGRYSFTGQSDWDAEVTPSLGTYRFTPPSRLVKIRGSTITGVDFAIALYEISGVVAGRAEAGVTMTLSRAGSSVATTTTDKTGRYTFGDLANGSYTVTPALAGGYVFWPGRRDVYVNGASVTWLDFTADGAYRVSGTITGPFRSGVTLSLSLDAKPVATTTSDLWGNWTFAGLVNGAYAVAPSLTGGGYAVGPESASATVDGGDVTGVAFDVAGAYPLSGTVTGPFVAGATIALNGAAASGQWIVLGATTDDRGAYLFPGLPNGVYAVSVGHVQGHAFAPADARITVKDAGASQDFAGEAYAQTTFWLSGTAYPTSMAAGPDGAVWFTEAGGIGRITTSGVPEELRLSPRTPFRIVAGGDGNLWFTEGASRPAIGRMAPDGSVAEYRIPSGRGALALTWGPDGNLWFTSSGENVVYSLTPAGVFIPHRVGPVATTVAATGLATGPDRNLWVTYGSSVFRCTTAWACTEFPAGPNAAGRLVSGPGQALWFAHADGMTRVTTDGEVTQFTSSGLRDLVDLAAGADGALWFTRSGASTVGRFTTGGVLTEFAVDGGRPTAITAGPDGRIWFGIAGSNAAYVGHL